VPSDRSLRIIIKKTEAEAASVWWADLRTAYLKVRTLLSIVAPSPSDKQDCHHNTIYEELTERCLNTRELPHVECEISTQHKHLTIWALNKIITSRYRSDLK
jgi:hypothetical protein